MDLARRWGYNDNMAAITEKHSAPIRTGRPLDLIEAQDRALTLAEEVGLAPPATLNAQVAVSRIAHALLAGAGGGMLTFAAVKREGAGGDGADGFEVTAAPNKQSWPSATSVLLLQLEIEGLLDEVAIAWPQGREGSPWLIARSWNRAAKAGPAPLRERR